MAKLITMTAFRRPDYTRQVLESLANCEGIEDWVLYPQIDFDKDTDGCEDTVKVFKDFDACRVRLFTSKHRQGLNQNTFNAIQRASRLINAEIFVHIEDDTVLSPDALTYFEYVVRQELIPDINLRVLLASGYNKPDVEPTPEQAYQYCLRPVWTPWGWAADKRRIDWLLAKWSFRNPKCFTCWFKKRFHTTKLEVYPLLSRVQNIGYELGENERTPEWYEANHRTPFVATAQSVTGHAGTRKYIFQEFQKSHVLGLDIGR